MKIHVLPEMGTNVRSCFVCYRPKPGNTNACHLVREQTEAFGRGVAVSTEKEQTTYNNMGDLKNRSKRVQSCIHLDDILEEAQRL